MAKFAESNTACKLLATRDRIINLQTSLKTLSTEKFMEKCVV